MNDKITTRATEKLWFTREVHELLRTRNTAFKSRDKDILRSARANLSRGVRAVKRAYGQKIQSHFTDTKDHRRLWQGIQSVTRPTPPPCEDNTGFFNLLNTFFTWVWEKHHHHTNRRPSQLRQFIHLVPADVQRILLIVNPRKAAGPDNISGCVRRDCADSLTYVLTPLWAIGHRTATCGRLWLSW